MWPEPARQSFKGASAILASLTVIADREIRPSSRSAHRVICDHDSSELPLLPCTRALLAPRTSPIHQSTKSVREGYRLQISVPVTGGAADCRNLTWLMNSATLISHSCCFELNAWE